MTKLNENIEIGNTNKKLKDLLLEKTTISGTTDSNGFLASNLSSSNTVIGCNFDSSISGFIIPYCEHEYGRWTFKIETWNRIPYSNRSLSINVYYKN